MASVGGPRQKMINMMYLVLTALLAMNISKEVINAFVIVNEGLEAQRLNLEGKNDILYNQFNAQRQLNPDNLRIKEYYEKAQDVKGLADELVNFMEEKKVELIALVEGVSVEQARNIALRDVSKLDDYDITTYFFGTDDPAKANKPGALAHDLKIKLNEYVNTLLSDRFLTKPEDASLFSFQIDTSDPETKPGEERVTWEIRNFYHLVVPAAMVNVTRLQNAVRTAEGDLVAYLYNQISASSFKFDGVRPAVIPNSNFVFTGDNFQAEIFVAAFNTTEKPTVIVNGQQIKDFTDDGRAILKIPAQGEGEKKFEGKIIVAGPMGDTEYPFEGSYMVAKPMAVVSPDKMNVFYRGLDNPVSVSVPGVPPSKIKVTAPGHTITGSNGKYIVKPGESNICKITVSADIDGKITNMGTMDFRVKRIPTPVLKFAGQNDGGRVSSAVAANGAIVPILEDFEFDVFAKVREFSISFAIDGSLVMKDGIRGNQIPSDIGAQLRRIKPGGKIFFDNIKVDMPDKTTRTLSAVYIVQN